MATRDRVIHVPPDAYDRLLRHLLDGDRYRHDPGNSEQMGFFQTEDAARSARPTSGARAAA